ncbi:glycosyltransferase family 2 protein [Nocardioides sp. BP30]|uniref:glycosyltransferase family 2 protein n=1 Tax=Nocardioides sp. BP30 TaxID=3036374 RepID=UPI002469AEFB|nr:glycosyltransferase family 2 protein [Nocardioides sp. BP30]WGL53689.1 glycosyltransferase family 2 protein [Nocardioides sp. BP30]
MPDPSVWIVMPAYNAAETVQRTYEDIPPSLRTNVLLVDDCSSDATVEIARGLGIQVVEHETNKGYGGNQKTCYRTALDGGADIIVMLHPDYQYDARMVDVAAKIIELGTCDMVLGNRIRTRREALGGGMPVWKYVLNRASTLVENFLLGQSIGDFHSGFRAYSRELLTTIPFEENDDDFAFDQELLVQAVAGRFKIGDVPVPVRYMEEASSINFRRSMRYGFGGLSAIIRYGLHRARIRRDPRLELEPTTRDRMADHAAK